MIKESNSMTKRKIVISNQNTKSFSYSMFFLSFFFLARENLFENLVLSIKELVRKSFFFFFFSLFFNFPFSRPWIMTTFFAQHDRASPCQLQFSTLGLLTAIVVGLFHPGISGGKRRPMGQGEPIPPLVCSGVRVRVP